MPCLRQRGLFGSEGSYALFEALIMEGGNCRVAFYDRPEGAAAIVRPLEN